MTWLTLLLFAQRNKTAVGSAASLVSHGDHCSCEAWCVVG